jgi:hypothetical protein
LFSDSADQADDDGFVMKGRCAEKLGGDFAIGDQADKG